MFGSACANVVRENVGTSARTATNRTTRWNRMGKPRGEADPTPSAMLCSAGWCNAVVHSPRTLRHETNDVLGRQRGAGSVLRAVGGGTVPDRRAGGPFAPLRRADDFLADGARRLQARK